MMVNNNPPTECDGSTHRQSFRTKTPVLKILDQHIGKAVFYGIFITLLALVLLNGVFAFFDELADTGRGDYGVLHAVWYVVITLPRRFYETFPTAAMIGAMLGVGQLANHAEIIVYQTAGVSKLRIAAAVIMGCIPWLLLMIATGELIAPSLEQQAKQMILNAQSEGKTYGVGSRLWARQNGKFINGEVIYLPSGEIPIGLLDVSVYEYGDDGSLLTMAHADEAKPDDDGWELVNLSEIRFTPHIEVKKYRQYHWDELLDVNLLHVLISRPDRLNIVDLNRYINYLEKNDLDAKTYHTAMWVRIYYPLSALMMIFACMPFVFSMSRSGGMGQRLFVGMLLGIGVFILNKSAVSIANVYSVKPQIIVILPSLLFFLASGWAMRSASNTR